jgi:hypothetical protein
MNLVVCLGIALLAAAHVTGVSGTVYIAPAHPGPQRIGESGRAPMSKASIIVYDAQHRVVARSITDASGRFAVTVSPGDYSVAVDVGAALLPRCATARASVQEGRMADVELECDSGMR